MKIYIPFILFKSGICFSQPLVLALAPSPQFWYLPAPAFNLYFLTPALNLYLPAPTLNLFLRALVLNLGLPVLRFIIKVC